MRCYQANETYFRWIYTAITRSKENLMVINPPSIKITDKATIHPIEEISPHTIPINYESENLIISSPYHNSQEFEFLIKKFSELKSKCDAHGIQITKVESRPKNYYDRYTFQKGILTTSIDFYFKKGGRFTRSNPTGTQNKLTTEILALNELLF